MQITQKIAGARVDILSAGAGLPALYLLLSEEDAAELLPRFTGETYSLIAVTGLDWCRDLSPGRAPHAFRGGEDFSGGADAFLEKLVGEILPETDRLLGGAPPFRAIGGYSLAGLFAVYALCRTGEFRRAACVSGSLWFDGFMDYLAAHFPENCPERVYFSLGDRESRTNHARLAISADCMAAAERQFAAHGAKTLLEWNRGGHFDHVPERIVSGIHWLME